MRLSARNWIIISAEYIPSCLNVEADQRSRNPRDSSEWKLLSQIFHQIFLTKGTPEIESFASHLSHQLPELLVYRSGPCSQGTDAMKYPWTNQYFSAFLYFSMINKVLNKIKQKQVEKMLFVTLTWQSQTWYPILLNMLIEKPVYLPSIFS